MYKYRKKFGIIARITSGSKLPIADPETGEILFKLVFPGFILRLKRRLFCTGSGGVG